MQVNQPRTILNDRSFVSCLIFRASTVWLGVGALLRGVTFKCGFPFRAFRVVLQHHAYEGVSHNRSPPKLLVSFWFPLQRGPIFGNWNPAHRKKRDFTNRRRWTHCESPGSDALGFPFLITMLFLVPKGEPSISGLKGQLSGKCFFIPLRTGVWVKN